MPIKSYGTKIKHDKLRGEWAEMHFMTKTTEHGLHVTKPWGDSASYDFAVEHDGHFSRVQVKSTMYKRFGGHCCQIRGSQRRAYSPNSFDFVAVYLILEDTWYIIPAASIAGRVNLYFRPELQKSKYNRYKEAWHLLRTKSRARMQTVSHIEACIAETPPLAASI